MEKAPGIHASDVTGVIFCGGLSQRMGQDKALMECNGQTMLERAHELLAPHVRSVVLSTGSQPRYESMGLDCVLDRRPDLGPIGGLQAALSECQTPWILAMACDLPGLESRLVETLMAAPQAHDAAVLFGSAGSPEPLFALYHRKLLPRVERAIGQGRRRMTSFLEEGPISGCDSGELRIQWLPCNEKIRAALVNVNRPEDWIQYQSNSQPQKP